MTMILCSSMAVQASPRITNTLPSACSPPRHETPHQRSTTFAPTIPSEGRDEARPSRHEGIRATRARKAEGRDEARPSRHEGIRATRARKAEGRDEARPSPLSSRMAFGNGPPGGRPLPGAGWLHALQATIYGDQVSALVSEVSVDTRANAKSLSLSGLSRLSGLSSKPGLASQPLLLRSFTSLAAVATWRRLHGRQTFRVFCVFRG